MARKVSLEKDSLKLLFELGHFIIFLILNVSRASDEFSII